MKTLANCALALTLVLAGDALFAQNPLRAQSYDSQSGTAGVDRGINNRIEERQSFPAVPLYDRQLVPAAFNKIPEPKLDLETIPRHDLNTLAEQHKAAYSNQDEQLNFVERDRVANVQPKSKRSPTKKQHFGQLMAKLGMNLAFVLAIAIGFILLAKNWMKPGVKTKSGSDSSESIQVIENVKLDAKTTLSVVQWQSQKILVANDAQGVKSMVVLNPAFDQTLDQFSAEPETESPPPTRHTRQQSRTNQVAAYRNESAKTKDNGVDERLIKMLLENANRQSAQNR